MNAHLWGVVFTTLKSHRFGPVFDERTSQLKFQLGDVSAEPLDITVHIVNGNVVGMAATTPAYPQKTDFARQICWQ